MFTCDYRFFFVMYTGEEGDGVEESSSMIDVGDDAMIKVEDIIYQPHQ